MEIYFDEAGRGPLAWPLYIGLVISKLSHKELKTFSLFRDSKKLSEHQREAAFEQIETLISEGKLVACIASVEAEFIDEYGVTKAIFFAICKGLYQLFHTLLESKAKRKGSLEDLKLLFQTREIEHHEKILLVLDGKSDFWLWKALEIMTKTVVHGDDRLAEISIASLLAKVGRDHEMYELAKSYPQYSFEHHKGYGTKAHYEAIEQYGICPLHRKLFLKKYFPDWKIKKWEEIPLLSS